MGLAAYKRSGGCASAHQCETSAASRRGPTRVSIAGQLVCPGPWVRTTVQASGLDDGVPRVNGQVAAKLQSPHAPVCGSPGGGSADLTFDHAGECTVTDGGAVITQTALLAKLPALV